MPRVLGFAFPAHGWFSKSNLIKIILHSGHECQLVVDPEKRDTIATRFFEVEEKSKPEKSYRRKGNKRKEKKRKKE